MQVPFTSLSSLTHGNRCRDSIWILLLSHTWSYYATWKSIRCCPILPRQRNKSINFFNRKILTTPFSQLYHQKGKLKISSHYSRISNALCTSWDRLTLKVIVIPLGLSKWIDTIAVPEMRNNTIQTAKKNLFTALEIYQGMKEYCI